jgi:hypothetical protein
MRDASPNGAHPGLY